MHRLRYRSLNTRLTAAGWRRGAALIPLSLAAAALPASAAPPPIAEARATGVVPGITTGGWTVDYNGYSHGLLVLKMHAALTLAASGYDGALSFHTAGMVGWMVHDVDDSHVQGKFLQADPPTPNPDRVAPVHFTSIGNLRGTDRVTRLSYRQDTPVLDTVTPDPKLERQPVPPAATPHTIDNLSALAMLVRQVADTGRCDGGATLFDGRRLTTLSARTAGTQALVKTDRSIFTGDALRCDVDGNQLYGFKNDESEAEQRRTKHGNAWLATMLPNEPPVPVRVIFTNKALGEVTLYLTAAHASPGALAQLPGARVQ